MAIHSLPDAISAHERYRNAPFWDSTGKLYRKSPGNSGLYLLSPIFCSHILFSLFQSSLQPHYCTEIALFKVTNDLHITKSNHHCSDIYTFSSLTFLRCSNITFSLKLFIINQHHVCFSSLFSVLQGSKDWKGELSMFRLFE